MLENKNVLKIISLIIAILLWVYVMGEVNPDTKGKNQRYRSDVRQYGDAGR